VIGYPPTVIGSGTEYRVRIRAIYRYPVTRWERVFGLGDPVLGRTLLRLPEGLPNQPFARTRQRFSLRFGDRERLGRPPARPDGRMVDPDDISGAEGPLQFGVFSASAGRDREFKEFVRRCGVQFAQAWPGAIK
jgi:hypothetical protein